MEIYKVQNLQKQYSKNVVLDGISTSFKSGDFVALLGANGSGKSTFLRLLAQDEQPTSGAVFFHNQNLQSLRVNCREDVLFLNENHYLPLSISVEQWAAMLSKQYVRYDKPLFYELMKRFDVGVDKVFSSLSRGQKMKTLFALHAPKKPNVYLIDEITSVLDVGSRLEMMSFLKKELVAGALVIMTTNIGSELQSIATDVFYLRAGKVALSCRKAELKSNFKKYRAVDITMEKILVESPAKLIHVNSDGSKTFMVENGGDFDYGAVLVDKREVTVEDVAAFYTIQEMVNGSF